MIRQIPKRAEFAEPMKADYEHEDVDPTSAKSLAYAFIKADKFPTATKEALTK